MAPLNSFILQYLFHNQFAFCFRKSKHYVEKHSIATLKNIRLLLSQDLRCFFVRGSNKKQRRVRIISNFTTGEIFSFLMTTKCSCGVILQCAPPPSSCTLKKRPSSPLQFGQREHIAGHSIERRIYQFILKIARIFPIPTKRNRMMNTFIMVSITPTCNR